MLGNRLTYLSPLIYIIFTSLTFTQTSLSVKNVSLTGSYSCTNASLTTEATCEAPGTCSDVTKITKTACETDGTCSVDTGSCSNSVYSTQLNCEAPGTCSDVYKTSKTTCEQASGTWTSTNTWTLTYPDKASCEPANTWTTTNTWTQTNIWGKDGTVPTGEKCGRKIPRHDTVDRYRKRNSQGGKKAVQTVVVPPLAV